MALTCKRCGRPVKVNRERLKVALGGTAMVMLMGLLMGTPTGWLALIPAAWHGSKKALEMMRYKTMLMEASKKAGAYFRCDNCGDIPLGEIFG